MTKVTIVAENPGGAHTRFRATAQNHESVGPTAGAALDALTAQLGDSSEGTIIVIQNLRPDQFFTAKQQQRLEELFGKWRAARDAGQTLSPAEESELETLVNAELDGAARRANGIAQELRR